MREELDERRAKRELDEVQYDERDQRRRTMEDIESKMIAYVENEPNPVESIALSLMEDDGLLERLSRYEQRLELSIHRNLRQLEKLRKQSQRDEQNGTDPSHKRCPFVPREAYDAARELHCTSSSGDDDAIEENEPTESSDADINSHEPISENEPKRTTRYTTVTKRVSDAMASVETGSDRDSREPVRFDEMQA
jgi:hypothetical protein